MDYILFTGVVTTGWEEVLKEVNEAENSLILIDRIPDCADVIDYAAAFGGDFVEEGRPHGLLGRELTSHPSAVAMRRSNAVILEGTTGASAATDRTTGIHEALADFPNIKVLASQTGNFTRAEGQAVMESFLKAHPDIDLLLAENDDMALGAIAAIKAAGKVPGVDIIIVGCDAVKVAFEAIVAGEMNATIECTPLYSPFVIEAIKNLEAGVVYDKSIMHPEEAVFDAAGGIACTADGTLLSIPAADVIDSRQY